MMGQKDEQMKIEVGHLVDDFRFNAGLGSQENLQGLLADLSQDGILTLAKEGRCIGIVGKGLFSLQQDLVNPLENLGLGHKLPYRRTVTPRD